MQHTLMEYCPVSGEPRPYPSHADQFRAFHGALAWLYDPWTGEHRHPADIGADVFGLAIVPLAEEVRCGDEARPTKRRK